MSDEWTQTVKLRPQTDMVKDQRFAEQMAHETREREQAEATAVERQKARVKEAEQIVPALPWAVLQPAFERGEDLSELLASRSPAYAALRDEAVKLTQEIDRVEGERAAKVSTALSPYHLAKFAETLQPLHEKRTELSRRLAACHEVAKQRISGALQTAIVAQVQLRADVLKKALPIDDRIGELEHMRSHFGVGAYGTKKLGIAKWIAKG